LGEAENVVNEEEHILWRTNSSSISKLYLNLMQAHNLINQILLAEIKTKQQVNLGANITSYKMEEIK
jgi:hypothetical protein